MHKLFNIGLQYFGESDTGANGQEVAAPASDEAIVTGADIDDDELDIIEDDDDEYDIDDGADEAESDEGAEQEQEQIPDRNAIFAEMRRQAEAEAKLKAQSTAAAEVDKIFADMGLRDPYTDKPITTRAEYDAYKAKHNAENITAELGKAGISPDVINSIISSHPAIKEASEAAQAYKTAQEQAQQQSARVRLDEQIKEISALDPAIKTADDLMALPVYDKIRDYVRRGLSIVEAYKLTNMDKLTDKKTAAAAQSAINKVASKEHLTSTTSRGKGDNPIPRKQLEMYRLLRPNMTDKEIKADWAKHSKTYKK